MTQHGIGERQTCFTSSATDGQVLEVAVRFVASYTIPVFTAVISIALAIVVDNEVVLVEAIADNFLVTVFVDFIVQIGGVVYTIGVEGLLARLAEGSKLSELGPVIKLGHDGQDQEVVKRW